MADQPRDSVPSTFPTKHVIHYPLNGLDLSLSNYRPARFTVRDIMANKIMQEYLFPKLSPLQGPPSQVTKQTHPRHRSPSDNPLGKDYTTLNQMLHTEFRFGVLIQNALRRPSKAEKCELMVRQNPDLLREILQRFYLETSHADVRFWFNSLPKEITNLESCGFPLEEVLRPLTKEAQQHLQSYSNHRDTLHELFLFSGVGNKMYRRVQAWNRHINTTKRWPPLQDVMWFHHPTYLQDLREANASTAMFDNNCVAPGRPRLRSSSLPPHDTFHWASIRDGTSNPSSAVCFKRLSDMELDHRTRRRSLSRRHISRMFTEPRLRRTDQAAKCALGVYEPDLFLTSVDKANITRRCYNCTIPFHAMESCRLPCGYCNSHGHNARECPASPQNRCRCSPFPNYHNAWQCTITCSRPCGSSFPTGHRQHKNAMTCRWRCCMCGVKGHSGKDCHRVFCRCGRRHLGQDCGWNPTCCAPDCSRYICIIHCRECGSPEKPFIGRTCLSCLKNSHPVGRRAED